MSDRTLPLRYSNDLIFELEKAFYDERGKGARFRMTKVGERYFRERCLPALTSSEIHEILGAVAGVLKADGIAAEVSWVDEERLLRVQVKGCVHRPVEEAMLSYGVEPFTCVPANLMVLAIEAKLDRPVELAEIKLEEGHCALLLVVFDKRPTLE